MKLGLNMEKLIKNIGILLIVVSIIFAFIIYSYTKNIIALNIELHKNCPLPEGVCPYKRSVPSETIFGATLSAVTALIGIYLFYSGKEIRLLTTNDVKKIKENLKDLKGDEKTVYELIKNSDGYILQSDLITKTGFSKVKVSRIIDKLELKNLVIRRRRGMSNVIILKEFE